MVILCPFFVLAMGALVSSLISGVLVLMGRMAFVPIEPAILLGKILGIAIFGSLPILLYRWRPWRDQSDRKEPKLALRIMWCLTGVLVLFNSFGAFAGQIERSGLVATYAVFGWSIEPLVLTQEGLVATLADLASQGQVQLPVDVDEVTTLAKIEADGTRLQKTYVVSREGMVMSEQFRTAIVQQFCGHEPFIPLLREGATFEETYVNSDGSLIGSQVITRDTCGF